MEHGLAELSKRIGPALSCVALTVACAARESAPPKRSCHYVVAGHEAALHVRMRCDGVRASRVASRVPGMEQHIELTSPSAASRRGRAWRVGRIHDVRYRVDMRSAATELDDFDAVANTDEHAFVAPLGALLLGPEPHEPGTRLTIRVRLAAGVSFATGAERSDDGYQLGAHELGVATYAAIGRFRVRRYDLPGPPRATGRRPPRHVASRGRAQLTVVFPASWTAQRVDELGDFIRTRAAAVAAHWRGFPTPHATVIVLPDSSNGVTFGRLRPASGPGIVLRVGRDFDAASLRRDWILVHELFHLGVPSFVREGRWWDEGTATYYEPIIRARAGWLDEHELWRANASYMVAGVRAAEGPGLEHTDDDDAVYWGGALAALKADSSIRALTSGRLGLEDGMVAVLAAGGDARRVWPLARAIEAMDAVWLRPILAQLARRHAERGSPIGLGALLARLGVARDGSGGVRLREDASWSPVRHWLVHPARSDEW